MFIIGHDVPHSGIQTGLLEAVEISSSLSVLAESEADSSYVSSIPLKRSSLKSDRIDARGT